MTGLFQDVRYAIRQLRKAPGFACTAILILALGIGGATAIFSTLYPILFEPLPYPYANRIMMIKYPGENSLQTFHTYRELAERNRTFETMAVMKVWQPTFSGTGQPERVDGQRVSVGYFRALGVPPALGRDFQPADDVLNGPKVVILSNGLWRRRYGGDGTIVGQSIKLDDQTYTIIGVMPSGFENVLSPSAEVWSPLQYDASNVTSLETREWGHHLRLVGRLKTDASVDRAKNDLAWIASTRVAEFPRARWASLDRELIVDSLQDDITRGVKPALLAVFGAVILVLLIACVNVTNLVLARGAQRSGEIAMRAALGAARPRVIRQLVTESLLLALLGGALGMVVIQAGIRVLVALSPAGLPRVNAIRMDGPVFLFAFAVAVLIGLAVGLIPALHALRGDLQSALRQSSQRTAGDHHLTQRVFVVAEVALALVLLVSAGLFLHSMRRLFSVPPGFDASGMLSMQVPVTMLTNADTQMVTAAARGILHELNPEIPPRFRTFSQIYSASLGSRRFNLILICFFGIGALLLATVGIFGVMAYAVSRRTSEIAVRVALGARYRDILTMILGEGVRTIFIGTAIGIAGSLALTRALESMLFGVTATDPLTFTVVILLLVATALLACYIPARRAAKVDPMVALRYE